MPESVFGGVRRTGSDAVGAVGGSAVAGEDTDPALRLLRAQITDRVRRSGLDQIQLVARSRRVGGRSLGRTTVSHALNPGRPLSRQTVATLARLLGADGETAAAWDRLWATAHAGTGGDGPEAALRDAGEKALRPPRSPTDLLRPQHAVVPFTGREELLAELVDWCGPGVAVRGERDAAPVVCARLLTGPGGSGKTRLAGELAARMAERGWFTLRPAAGTDADLEPFSRLRRPALVVVDYAETRVGQLADLLDRVDRDDAETPVRLVLLARAAGEWWERAADDPRADLLRDELTPRTEMPLLLPSPAERAGAWAAAVEAFAAVLGGLEGYRDVDWGARVRELTVPGRVPTGGTGTPLASHTDALLALLDSAAPGTAAPGSSPEAQLLRHETRYWQRTAERRRQLTGERVGPAMLAQAVALAALVPADGPEQARELLSLLDGLRDDAAASVRAALADWLRDLYPPADGSYWGGIQPDRTAEHHIGAQLADAPSVFRRVLGRLDPVGAEAALTVLSRTGEHPAYRGVVEDLLREAVPGAPAVLGPAALAVATRTAYPGPVVGALERLLAGGGDTALLERLEDLLPRHSTALAGWAAELAAALVDRGDDDPRERAAALNDLSVRLADLGRADEALEFAERAVEAHRALADDGPGGDHRLRLGRALSNRSVQLAAVGRLVDALGSVDEAVPLLGAATGSGGGLGILRDALSNRANHLAALGREEEALRCLEQAIEIGGAPHDGSPPALLNNHAVHLLGLGRPAEALASVERAITWYRARAESHPDGYLPALARALNTRDTVLSALGRWEEAAAAAEESVRFHDELARSLPVAHRPSLVTSLNNWSICLLRLERYEQARAAIDRAVTLCRELGAVRPQDGTVGLATVLANQAQCLLSSGFPSEALEVADEAVRRYEESGAVSAWQVSALARALSSRGECLLAAGRHADALTDGERAVRLLRGLSAGNGAHRTPLARALQTLSVHYAVLDRPRDAVRTAGEAVEVCEALERDLPGSHLGDLAAVLTVRGAQENVLGRRRAAYASTARALEIHRGLARGPNAAAHRAGLAGTLTNHSAHLAGIGRTAEAVETAAEAVAVRGALAASSPRVHARELAAAQHGLSLQLAAAGRESEALEPARAATAALRELEAAGDDMGLWLPHALRNLGSRLTLAGRPADALAPAEEAVRRFEALSGDPSDVSAGGPASATRTGLALALYGWSESLAAVGRDADALAASTRGLRLWSAAAHVRPALRYALAESHNQQAIRLYQLDRFEDALGELDAALDLEEALEAAEPGLRSAQLAQVLLNRAIGLVALDRAPEALAPVRRAAGILRGLVATAPARFVVTHITAVFEQARLLASLGRDDTAVDTLDDGVRLWRALAQAAPHRLPALASALEARHADWSAAGLDTVARRAAALAVAIRAQAEEH